MRRVLWLLAAALVATGGLAGARPVRAQQPLPHREGFWIGVGLGYGSASMPCFQCPGDGSGVTAVLRMGGTVSRRLRVGGEVNAWSPARGGSYNDMFAPEAYTVGDVSVVALLYPSATGTFFLKGGAGIVEFEENTVVHDQRSEAGVSIGLGIDLYLGRRFSLTPTASYVTAVTGRTSLITIGLAATWH